MLRLILLALPLVIAWMVSPTGLPLSFAKIGAGEAGLLDWVKIGGLFLLGIFFSMMPGSKD